MEPVVPSPLPQQPAPQPPASPMPPPLPTEAPQSRLPLFAGIAVVVLIALGLAAWFVWPFPQMRLADQRGALFTAFNQNDLDAVIAQTDALLAKNPNDSELLITKAIALAQKGSLFFKEIEYGAQAEAAAQAAIALDPENSEAWRALAYSFEIRQDYAKAHEYYAKALQLNPNNAAALFGEAHSYDLQGDLTKAEAGYRAAIAANPDMAQAYAGLGRVLSAKGDAAGAMKEFETSFGLALNARAKAEAAYSAGILLMNDDRDSSIGYMRQAVDLDPTYPLAWYGLGKALISKAVFSTESSTEERNAIANEGIDALDKAIELNPNQSVAYVELARIAVSGANNPTEGIRLLDDAERAVPNDITLSAPAKDSVLRLIGELRAAFKERQ